MTPILDPRQGDFEDDASSTKKRSLLSLAGSLLVEVSLPKLVIVWMLLVGLPALLLGAVPILISAWLTSVSAKLGGLFSSIWPALLLPPIVALGWYGGRTVLRIAESSFWSLNALVVQPAYVAFREGMGQLAERWLPPSASEKRRASVRAGIAATAGFAVFLLGIGLAGLAWPSVRWIVTLAELTSYNGWLPVLVANSVLLVSTYFAFAGLIWGIADALMPQPSGISHLWPLSTPDRRVWRIAHLSDLHVVGERHGFRIESGRAGPRGNDALMGAMAQLSAIHQVNPVDVVLITGDLTDAGRSAEWAELFGALSAFPELAERVVAAPGNHDVNVVDRASPARLEVPTSPTKRLRKLRMLSVLGALQGTRVRTINVRERHIGPSLTEMLGGHADAITAFADKASARTWASLSGLWDAAFPMILPPDPPDGLGIIVLNSNAETHFSFTNALGLVAVEQMRGLEVAVSQYPNAVWVVAMHHHVIEYPQPVHALSERIGTALINGSWFIRRLQRLAGRLAIMHGHRHVDWIGYCGNLLLISAPSPVMNTADGTPPHFYIHGIERADDGSLRLLTPERINVDLADSPSSVSKPAVASAHGKQPAIVVNGDSGREVGGAHGLS